MKEEIIVVTIGADGKLRAETEGLKGKACERELAELLADIASISEVTRMAEADEPETEAHVRRDVTVGTKP
jgi:hypothetical protein